MAESKDVQVTEYLDEFGRFAIKVHSPKYKTPFIIHKTEDGHAMYSIKGSLGLTSTALEGWFTSSDDALRHLKSFLRRSKDSDTVTRDKTRARSRKYKENAKATAKPDNSEHLRKGSAD